VWASIHEDTAKASNTGTIDERPIGKGEARHSMHEDAAGESEKSGLGAGKHERGSDARCSNSAGQSERGAYGDTGVNTRTRHRQAGPQREAQGRQGKEEGTG
jgi:hypothetical protein